MSVKEHYEVITHEVTEKFLVGKSMYCDVCKKEIEKGKGYWAVTTGNHNDWTEDTEHFDVCSEICLMTQFAEYMDDSGNDEFNDNEKYIEVEKRYFKYAT